VQRLAALPVNEYHPQFRLERVGLVVLGDRRKAHDLPILLRQHVTDKIVPRVTPEGRLSCSRA